MTGALIGSTLLGAGTSILAGKKQAKAAGKAADAQVQAARENIEFQKWLYEDTKAQQQPWVDVGLKALGQLQRYAGVDGVKAERPKLVRTTDLRATEAEQDVESRQQEIRDMSDDEYVRYVYSEGLGATRFTDTDGELSKKDKKGLSWWKGQLKGGSDRKSLATKMGAQSLSRSKGEVPIASDLYMPSFQDVQEKEKEVEIDELKARQNALMYGGVR